MTMPYNVKPESDLDKLKPGDAITADVVVQDEKAWLENIAVAGPAASGKK
jgi:Cu/Ag efflux protein CusF